MTQIHGLSKADIDTKDSNADYVSVLMLVEEANAEYTMLIAADRWGPKGKPDRDPSPEGHLHQSRTNHLGAKQVSAALKQHTTQQQSNKQSNISLGENKQSKNKSKSGDTETKKKSHITKQAWKAQPPDHGVPEMKQASGKTWHWCVTCGFS